MDLTFSDTALNLILIGCAAFSCALAYLPVRKLMKHSIYTALMGLVAYFIVGRAATGWLIDTAEPPIPPSEDIIALLYDNGDVSYNWMLESWNTLNAYRLMGAGFGLLAALMTGLLVRWIVSKKRTEKEPAEAPTRQLVGGECRVCHKRIVTASSGMLSPTTGQPIHIVCQPHADKEETE